MRNYKMLSVAKRLRREMTEAEKILWSELRAGKMGIKFRRQMPFVFGKYKFVADFYCSKLKLIIEVDGSVHDKSEAKELDNTREDIFIESGYSVIRFKNKEIYSNLNEVLNKIKSHIQKAPSSV